MGDKSLKLKPLGQKQKDTAKTGDVAAAQSKQDSYRRPQPPVAKGQK